MRAALLVALALSLPLAANAAGPVIERGPVLLKPSQSWEDRTQWGMPADGKRTVQVFDDARAFAARWQAVRPRGKVPEVDFRTSFAVEVVYPGGQFSLD